jgi:hypothetical protein
LIGCGAVPVVKSYPQFSQNSAPGAAGEPQCGQVVAALDASAGSAGLGTAGPALVAASIGAPQMSQ